eukprot:1160506-Pelagomonas_calceolata.AAC.1
MAAAGGRTSCTFDSRLFFVYLWDNPHEKFRKVPPCACGGGGKTERCMLRCGNELPSCDISMQDH